MNTAKRWCSWFHARGPTRLQVNLLKLVRVRVRRRVRVKIKAVPSTTYLSDDLHRLADIPSRRRLRSATSLQLDVPRTHRRTVGDRAFAATGPTLWNSLPHATGSALEVFLKMICAI